jgi:hypothetical protein
MERSARLRAPTVLGFYTVEGLEYALHRYGILQHLRRLGYGAFRIALDRDQRGDRMRLFATSDGKEDLLYEAVLESAASRRGRALRAWLTLRHRGRFSAAPRLPGQDQPGSGWRARRGYCCFRRHSGSGSRE